MHLSYLRVRPPEVSDNCVKAERWPCPNQVMRERERETGRQAERQRESRIFHKEINKCESPQVKENTVPSRNCKCPSRSKGQRAERWESQQKPGTEGSFYSGRLGESLKEHVANNHDPCLRKIHHSGRNCREARWSRENVGGSECRAAVAVGAGRNGEKAGRGF